MKQELLCEVCILYFIEFNLSLLAVVSILWKLPFALTITLQRQDIAGHCYRMPLLYGHGNPRERRNSGTRNKDTNLQRKALARAHGHGRVATIRNGTFREQQLQVRLHDTGSSEPPTLILHLQ